MSPEEILNKFKMGKPDTRFSDIGGLNDVKNKLISIGIAFKHMSVYESWGTRPPRGIVLYGKPGTGKTMLCKALANECDAEVYHLDIAQLGSMWRGQEEKMIKAIFEGLRKRQGLFVLLIDEIDAIWGAKNNNSEASNKAKNTWLSQIEGLMDDPIGSRFLVVGTTNRIESIDPAFLRSGRLDWKIEIPAPSPNELIDIINALIFTFTRTANRPLFKEEFGKNEDKIRKVLANKKLTDSDIHEILRRLTESKAQEEAKNGERPDRITLKDFLEMLENYCKENDNNNNLSVGNSRVFGFASLVSSTV